MENITFKTAGGVEVVLKAYITGRQAETLTDATGETPEKKNLAIMHKGMELVVVSINGSTEDILNKVLDLPFADYTEVAEKVAEIALGKKKEVSTPTTL